MSAEAMELAVRRANELMSWIYRIDSFISVLFDHMWYILHNVIIVYVHFVLLYDIYLFD